MKREFSALQEQAFDLLVCGGGIYGAWTVYDATLRGLKAALVAPALGWDEAAINREIEACRGAINQPLTHRSLMG